MKKTCFIFTLFLAQMMFIPRGWAETVYFNDGKVIQGEIQERTKTYIIIQSGRVPRRYYLGEIDRIEDDKKPSILEKTKIDVTQFEGITSTKAALIINMLDVSGVWDNMEKSINHAVSRLPEAERAVHRRIFNVEDIIERLIPIYDKYYTESEVEEVIQFYQGPAGKKVLEVTPQIMKESVGVMVRYVKERTGG